MCVYIYMFMYIYIIIYIYIYQKLCPLAGLPKRT